MRAIPERLTEVSGIGTIITNRHYLYVYRLLDTEILYIYCMMYHWLKMNYVSGSRIAHRDKLVILTHSVNTSLK